MAINTHNPSDNCPVATLAHEAERLIDAYYAIDGESFVKRHDPETKAHLEALEKANNQRLVGIEEWSSHLVATSPTGAKFQVCIASSFVDRLHVESDERERENLARKIDRLLYSLSAYFESNYGIKMDDACAGFYMASKLSPHKQVAEGLSRLDGARIAAE